MKKKRLFFCGLMMFFILMAYGTILPKICISAAYPENPIQFVIPNVAGAQTDIIGRILAAELEKILNVKIIPNNKPGASTILATDFVARAKKDGYTLLYAGASAMVYVPIYHPEVVKFDPVKDLEPLGLHFFFPQTITVRADSPWKTFDQFIEFARKNPEKIKVSTTGIGSSPHFILEMIQYLTKTKFTHVPFEGGESVVTALLGGHVEATCEALSKVKPHVEAGKMRILLITNKMSQYPTVPTITELGYKEALPQTWWGLWAPSGIPEQARKVLINAMENGVKNTKSRVEQLGNIVEYRTPAEVKRLREEEYKKISELAERIGLKKKN